MATDIAKLGVEVDPTGATRGTAVVKRALSSMGARAKKETANVGASFKRLKKQLFSVKSAVAGVFTGFAIRGVVSKTRAFGQAIADLKAITGATGEDLQFLSDAALEMGSTTTLAATEAAEAIKLIASAKPDLLESVEALAAVTEEVITLSEASGVLLPDAAKTLGLALNQFGADASEAGRFVNVLAAGAKFGSSEVAETGQAIEKAGVVAKLAGISFEELNAMIQILAANGIKGAIAGTQLRGVLLSLGEEGAAVNPKFVGINKALSSFSSIVDDSQAAVRIFGRENITAASILAKTTGTLDTLTKKMTGTSIAYEQQHTRTETLDGDIKELGSRYEKLLIILGDSNQKTIRATVQGMSDLVTEVTELAEQADIISAAFGTTIPISVVRTISALDKLRASGKIKLFGIGESGEDTRAELERQLALIERDRIRAEKIITDRRKKDLFGDDDKPGDKDLDPFIPKVPTVPELLLRPADTSKTVDSFAEKLGADMDAFIAKQAVFLEQGENLEESLFTPLQQYNAEVAKYNELRLAGAISEELFASAVSASNAQLIEQQKEAAEVNDTAKELGQTFTSAFEDAVIAGKNFSDVIDSLIQDLARLAIRKLLTDQIFGAVSGFFDGLGGGTPAAEPVGTGTVLKLAHGGSFTVGGKGGVDQNLVQFQASRGERVTVTTPEQQAEGSGIVMNNNYDFSGRDLQDTTVLKAELDRRDMLLQTNIFNLIRRKRTA